MWHNHPFSPRNKETKIALGLEVGSEGALQKFEKGGDRQYKGGAVICGEISLLRPLFSVKRII